MGIVSHLVIHSICSVRGVERGGQIATVVGNCERKYGDYCREAVLGHCGGWYGEHYEVW